MTFEVEYGMWQLLSGDVTDSKHVRMKQVMTASVGRCFSYKFAQSRKRTEENPLTIKLLQSQMSD